MKKEFKQILKQRPFNITSPDPDWYEKWDAKRETTDRNFPTKKQQQEAIDLFEGQEIDQTQDLNPELTRPFELWDIFTGKSQRHYYGANGNYLFDKVEERIWALETSGLQHPENSGCLITARGMSSIATAAEALALHDEGIFIYSNGMYPSTSTILGPKSANVDRSLVGTYPGIAVDTSNPDNLRQVLEDINSPKYLEAVLNDLKTVTESGKWDNVLASTTDTDTTNQFLTSAENLEDLAHVIQTMEGIVSTYRKRNVLGIFAEPVGNPSLKYTDPREISDIAHNQTKPIPTVWDNTFTPGIISPLMMGGDIVAYSITKGHSGEGDLSGGALILPKEFMGNSWHVRKHMGYTMALGTALEYTKRVLDVVERMEQHYINARTLANSLKELKQKFPEFEVLYNDLDGITRDGYAGSVVSFTLKEGFDEEVHKLGEKFAEYVSTHKGPIEHAVSFCGKKTHVLPFGGQVRSLEWLKSHGINPSLGRISTGRESPEELEKVIDYVKDGVRSVYD